MEVSDFNKNPTSVVGMGRFEEMDDERNKPDK